MNNVLKTILNELLDTNVQLFIDKLSKLSSSEIINLLADNVHSNIFEVLPDNEGGATFKIKLNKNQVKELLLELYKQF